MAKQQEQLLLQVFAPFCSQIILPAKATPMLQLQYRRRCARKVVRTLGLKKQKVNINGEKIFNVAVAICPPVHVVITTT